MKKDTRNNILFLPEPAVETATSKTVKTKISMTHIYTSITTIKDGREMKTKLTLRKVVFKLFFNWVDESMSHFSSSAKCVCKRWQLVSLLQIIVFMCYGIMLNKWVLQTYQPDFMKSPLVYHPGHRAQVWRFFSYMFMHVGYVPRPRHTHAHWSQKPWPSNSFSPLVACPHSAWSSWASTPCCSWWSASRWRWSTASCG